MRQLAIECASEACSIALFEDQQLLAHFHEVLGRGHAERLIGLIAKMPDKGRADRILVSRGPGSFTGLRIGMAAARALSLAWRSDLLSYPVLALVTSHFLSQHANTPVSIAMRAGHGEIFQQDFDANGLPQNTAASLAPADAARRAAHAHVAGTMAQQLVSERGHGEPHTLYPDARHVMAIAPDLISDTLTLEYGRAPDAKPAPLIQTSRP